MKNLIVIIIITFTLNYSFAQDWLWAKQGAANGATLQTRGSAIDASGNIYVYGYYINTIVIGTQTLNAYGGRDIFLTKFNSSGVFQWAIRAGSDGNEDPFGVDVDASGNVYITGGFNLGTGAFVNGQFEEGAIQITSGGGQSVFLAKYNSSGVCQWAKNVGDNAAGARAYDILVDNNDLIITGFFKTNITLGPGDINEQIFAAVDTRDFFIAKFDNTGTITWAKQYHSNNANTNILKLAKHDGVGYYGGGALFGNLTFDDLGPTTLSSAGSGDVFIFKIATDGTFSWAYNEGDALDDQIKDITSDASGNLFITGYIQGSYNFGGIPITTNSADFFIAKYNSSGVISWITNSNIAGADLANGIKLFNNYIYLTGYFNGTVSIGDNQLISGGGKEAFIASFDNTGTPIDANYSSGALDNVGENIEIDSKGNTYVSGYLYSAATIFNATTINNADANPDLFLAKYNWTVKMDNTDVSCNGGSDGSATPTPIGGTAPFTYLWSDGQTSQTAVNLSAGTYSVTVADFASTQAIDYVTITEPAAALSLATVVTNVVACPGATGAIDLTISDGTSPYTQSWSTGAITEDINGLVAGTYSVTVTDANGCQETTSAIVECSDSWVGVNSDWNDVGNWTSGSVPDATTNVTINAGVSPVIDNNFQCNDLTLNAGFSITINPNASLIVNGDANLAGDLTIESDNTGTGAFVNLGAFVSSGTHTVNRYLSTSEFHMVSSPITTGDLSLYTAEADLIDLLGYDETDNTADWMNGWDNTVAGAMTACKGYAAKFANSLTLSYIGTVYAGAQNINVTNTDGAEIADHEGWNLVGNPYPSPIDWDAASGWTKTNINDEIHFWDGSQYADYNNGSGTNGGTRFIPAMQGFMVKCNNVGGAGNLAMDNNVRVVSTQSYWKSTIENELKLNLSYGSNKDELVVRFMEEATENYDNYDAYKMYTNVADIPNVFTLSEDSRNLSINTFSAFGESKTVKLGYKVETTGTYTFNLVSSSFGNNVLMLIEDTETGITTNLSQNGSLSVTLNQGESSNRFLLHITKSLNIDNISAIPDMFAYSNEKNIYVIINNFNVNMNYKLYVFDITGKEIFNELISEKTTSVNLQNYDTGFYVVKVISDENNFTEKVFLK